MATSEINSRNVHRGDTTDTISVIFRGQYLIASPDVERLLDLHTVRGIVAADGNEHDGAGVRESLLYTIDPRWPELQQIRACRGLQSSLEERARRLGLEVSTSLNPWPEILPPPVHSALRSIGIEDLELVDYLWYPRRFNGLIRFVPGTVYPSWLIAQALVAFPGCRVAVMVASRKSAKQLVRQLGQWVSDVVAVTSRHHESRNAAIVVGTPAGLANNDICLWSRHFLFVLDARLAITSLGEWPLFSTDARFRVFGLLPVGVRLSPYESDRLFGIYGPEEICIAAHGMRDRPVCVISMTFEGPTVDGGLQPPPPPPPSGQATGSTPNVIAVLLISLAAWPPPTSPRSGASARP